MSTHCRHSHATEGAPLAELPSVYTLSRAVSTSISNVLELNNISGGQIGCRQLLMQLQRVRIQVQQVRNFVVVGPPTGRDHQTCLLSEVEVGASLLYGICSMRISLKVNSGSLPAVSGRSRMR